MRCVLGQLKDVRPDLGAREVLGRAHEPAVHRLTASKGKRHHVARLERRLELVQCAFLHVEAEALAQHVASQVWNERVHVAHLGADDGAQLTVRAERGDQATPREDAHVAGARRARGNAGLARGVVWSRAELYQVALAHMDVGRVAVQVGALEAEGPRRVVGFGERGNRVVRLARRCLHHVHHVALVGGSRFGVRARLLLPVLGRRILLVHVVGRGGDGLGGLGLGFRLGLWFRLGLALAHGLALGLGRRPRRRRWRLVRQAEATRGRRLGGVLLGDDDNAARIVLRGVVKVAGPVELDDVSDLQVRSHVDKVVRAQSERASVSVAGGRAVVGDLDLAKPPIARSGALQRADDAARAVAAELVDAHLYGPRHA